MNSQNKIIGVEGLTMEFDGRCVLDNVSADVFAGDFVAITGPNGGGKSTLLRTVLRLIKPTYGKVEYFWEGHSVNHLKFGYLPQKNNVDSRFPLTVEEVVASGLLGDRQNRLGDFSDYALNLIDETIRQVGMQDHRRQVIGTLSGGQLQRALIGRAIISQPDVVILDEPLSYLDRRFIGQIYEIVADIAKRATILLVSHKMTVISEMANRHWIVDRTLHECHASHHYLKTECD